MVDILPALRKAGIAYRAIEIEALKEQQHVMDVLSLTRGILHLGAVSYTHLDVYKRQDLSASLLKWYRSSSEALSAEQFP